jgi:hypothetical protein
MRVGGTDAAAVLARRRIRSAKFADDASPRAVFMICFAPLQ